MTDYDYNKRPSVSTIMSEIAEAHYAHFMFQQRLQFHVTLKASPKTIHRCRGGLWRKGSSAGWIMVGQEVSVPNKSGFIFCIGYDGDKLTAGVLTKTGQQEK